MMFQLGHIQMYWGGSTFFFCPLSALVWYINFIPSKIYVACCMYLTSVSVKPKSHLYKVCKCLASSK